MSPPPSQPQPSTSTSTTASLALNFLETRTDPKTSSPSLMSQIAHRQELVAYWGIEPGSRVLEIGCGQGDTTVALADAVGEEGWVVALDPGEPGYGSPFTLAQAQAHILSSPLGPRITFHFTSPLTYLRTYTGPPYDYIVLSHCTYYFSTPLSLPTLLTTLAPHTKTLCIAEWSLHASHLNQIPHVMTALLLSTLESKRAETEKSTGNIRTVLSPKQISNTVLALSTTLPSSSEAAFRFVRDAIKPSNPGLQDPYWEVSFLLLRREEEIAALRARVKDGGVTESEIVGVEAAYDVIEGLVGGLEGGARGVKCMDFWVGVWERV